MHCLGACVAFALGCSWPRGALSQSSRTADLAARAASDALAEGLPWRATQLLAPALADPARRTPAIVLLAATAAAGWDAWSEAERLLEHEPWIDTLFGGRGRVLLARAALERGADSSALLHASRSLASARTPADRGARLVLIARAFDRLDQRDSARTAYTGAAGLLGDASDWLELRAAGVTADSAARAAMYATLRTDIARARIQPTEAAARERTGDLAGAARLYASLGSIPAALRLRAAAASDSTARDSVRRALLAFIATQSGSGDARTAVDILDRAFSPLEPAEELVVARSAARSGPVTRAASAFARALARGVVSAADRFAYATALVRSGSAREAAAQFARIEAPRWLAAAATYQRARALLASGDGGTAKKALRAVMRLAPEDTSAAAAAMLLADLATDDGRDDDARAGYLDVARRFASAPSFAARSRFRAAIIALAAVDARVAALEMDSLRARYPNADDATAAAYWSGRAWAAAGDSARARDRWRDVIRQQPLSYYAMVSARRLGEAAPAPPAARDAFAVMPAVDSAMRRGALLEELGMDTEARLEYDRLAGAPDASAERLLAVANAFRARGLLWRTPDLAQRAIARGAPADARAYRLIYPVAHREAIDSAARERGVEPALLAALIRQESGWNPRATSAAGARGLTQVMPEVGRAVARSMGIREWSAAMLYQPEINVQLGLRHFEAFSRNYPDLAHLLAAYNAGGSRVTRWNAKRGADDPELFTERIPFTETRDYVRIVLRNRDLYRALYPW